MLVHYRSPVARDAEGRRLCCTLEVDDSRDWAEVGNWIRAKLWPLGEFHPATRAELDQVAREAEAGAKAFQERMGKRGKP